MDPKQEAIQAQWFGPDFVEKAARVARNLRNPVPVEWLLATMSWETGNYSSYWGPEKVDPRSGLHWSVNPDPNDAGGGLFGWPHLARSGYADMTPLEQLDLVGPYIDGWQTRLKMDSFPSPTDFYVLVRGPYGLLPENYDNDDFDMGAGRTLGWVRETYWNHVSDKYGWSPDNYPGMEPSIRALFGLWCIRIGNWLGEFVFTANGKVWYATRPENVLELPDALGALHGTAEREIDMADRTYGHWHIANGKLKWRFQPATDIRRWEANLPVIPTCTVVNVQPAGQGSFKMWKGPMEPV